MSVQPGLAGIAPALPDGFTYVEDAIDAAEEARLLESCRALPLEAARYKGYVAKRRTASFGSGYDFAHNALTAAPPIPGFLLPLRDRAAACAELDAGDFAHALVTEYAPGTELGWHRDVPEFGIVVGVSLLGACRMRFRPWPPPARARAHTVAVELAPRSLYVIRDAARWKWQHSVAPTPSLRYSITFRTARERR